MRYTSRKLLIAIAVVALITWLLTGKVITETTWLELMKLALGGYLTANVGQKAVEAIAAKLAPKAPAATTDAKP